MGYLSNAGVFLISTLFGLYEIAILLRLLMQVVRADFYNPVSQFVVKITNPPLRPMRRIIPSVAGIDIASLVLLLLVVMLELFLLSVVSGKPLPYLPGLLALTVVTMLKMLVYFYLFSIFVLVILSWVNPGSYNPIANLFQQLTAPLMRPARRLIPPMGGLDLSPMLVMIGLWLVIILLVAPLTDWAGHLAYGYKMAVFG